MEPGDAFALLAESADREKAALARTLHGTILQNLAAASMHLSAPASKCPAPGGAVARCAELIDRSIADVRALSYCSEPPLVDALGMHAALEVYAMAFERIHHRRFLTADAPARCAGLRGGLAAALVRSIRDAAREFAEAGADVVRATFSEGDGDTVGATLEADFDAAGARTGLELLALVASARLRPHGGEAQIAIAPTGAKLVMRARASE